MKNRETVALEKAKRCQIEREAMWHHKWEKGGRIGRKGGIERVKRLAWRKGKMA
jgi:hypothetical protein